MGLDMYLHGRKFHWNDWEKPENNRMEDGFKVSHTVLELGYWRKHPNLHGYIVNTFADGVDECQDIDLSMDALKKTLQAVEEDQLPHTKGFFFGKSMPEDREESITILQKAIAWLATPDERCSRRVYYRASW